MNDDRELAADERERMNIWHDITHLHKEAGVALTKIVTHESDPILTMPMRELQGIQQRLAGLATRLQEVAGRE